MLLFGVLACWWLAGLMYGLFGGWIVWFWIVWCLAPLVLCRFVGSFDEEWLVLGCRRAEREEVWRDQELGSWGVEVSSI